MGCWVKFFSMVRSLLGNVLARVSVNGNLSNSFWLSRSIRQGYPRAPLLYAITADELNWLVQDRIQDGHLNGVMFGNGSQVCIEMFADDTNAVVEKHERSISYF